MKQYSDSLTPALRHACHESMNNLFFRVEMPDAYRETVHWLIVGEAAGRPSAVEQLRNLDELSLVESILEEGEETFSRFAFDPTSKMSLFEERPDSGLQLVVEIGGASSAPAETETEPGNDGKESRPGWFGQSKSS